MKKKQAIRLNEGQLKKVVAEAVKRVLNESVDNNMERYLYKLTNAAKMLKKISGKSSTDEPQDTLASRVWNFVNALDDLLLNYDLSDYCNEMCINEDTKSMVSWKQDCVYIEGTYAGYIDPIGTNGGWYGKVNYTDEYGTSTMKTFGVTYSRDEIKQEIMNYINQNYKNVLSTSIKIARLN